MSAIADLMVHLIASGIPVEAVKTAIDLAQKHAVETVEIHRNSTGIPRDAVTEKRRAYDRERKRKPAKEHIDTLPPSSDSQGSKEEIVGRAKAARGSRLPADWVLSNKGACFALPLLGEARTKLESLKFKDFWHAKAGQSATKMDWEATWRMWVRNVIERIKSNGNNGKPGIMDAADDLLERVRNLDQPAPRDLRDGTGAAPLRLISER